MAKIWIFVIHEVSVQQIWEKVLHTATKTGPGSLKPGSKKVAYKSAKATSEFIGNKIAGKIVKPKLVPDANSRNVKEIVIRPEKREEMLNKLIQVLENGTLYYI